MSAILGGGGDSRTQAHSEAEPGLQIAGVQTFGLAQIGSRLSSQPHLVAAFWEEIGDPVNPAYPALTVAYCSLGSMGRASVFLELVAGDTREALVTRSNP